VLGVNPAQDASRAARANRVMSPISGQQRAENPAASTGPTPGISWIAWWPG
jgi:hypothetical protein